MNAGRILVALMFVVGALGAWLNGDVLYSRLVYISIFLVIISWVWTRWAIRGLSLERSTREQRANVGDVLEENYRLANKSLVPAPWIEVANQSPMPLAAGSRLFTLVMRRQQRNYTARSWLTRRGGFPLGPTRVTTGDPFGLFSARKTILPDETLVVFPIIYEIPSFPFPYGLLPGGQVIRRKSPDITPHAAGVREYVHGDAMKRIHWSTSARRNRLMVKEFEQDPNAEIWLYLDAQMSVHYEKQYRQPDVSLDSMLLVKRPKFNLPPSTLEYSVSIAASLAHYFIAQRRAVGMVSAGHTFTVLSAERNERQEAKILETLAFVKADGTLSIEALVAAQASQLPQRSTVILITPTVRPGLLQAVDDLQLRHLHPIVVLLEAHTFGGPQGTSDIVNALRERQIPVHVIACDDNISQVLAEIPATFQTQGAFSWQTPVLSP